MSPSEGGKFPSDPLGVERELEKIFHHKINTVRPPHSGDERIL